MKVIVRMEIVTPNYDGTALMQEIVKLLKDLDPDKTRVVRFKTWEKGYASYLGKNDINWKESDIQEVMK